MAAKQRVEDHKDGRGAQKSPQGLPGLSSPLLLVVGYCRNALVVVAGAARRRPGAPSRASQHVPAPPALPTRRARFPPPPPRRMLLPDARARSHGPLRARRRPTRASRPRRSRSRRVARVSRHVPRCCCPALARIPTSLLGVVARIPTLLPEVVAHRPTRLVSRACPGSKARVPADAESAPQSLAGSRSRSRAGRRATRPEQMPRSRDGRRVARGCERCVGVDLLVAGSFLNPLLRMPLRPATRVASARSRSGATATASNARPQPYPSALQLVPRSARPRVRALRAPRRRSCNTHDLPRSQAAIAV
ncbi:hypothetical protein EV121DRAFT_291233 [Schizophyllum commune]